ncbi:hypothetical protein ACWDUN_07800 [Mycobacterium sp. NPDC003323]
MRTLWTMTIAAAAVLLSPVAPAVADETAIETIGRLEAQGYMVNVDRVGSAPLERCVVTSVRNPQQVTRLVRVEDGGWGKHDSDDLVEIVVSQSISVSLDCTR